MPGCNPHISNHGTGGYVDEVMKKVLLLNRKSMVVGFSFFILISLAYWSSNPTLQAQDINVIDAAQIQVTRRNLMREYCLTHSYRKELDFSTLWHILVDDENKIMYCFIPKVGSRTWKKVLAELQGFKEDVDRIHIETFWRRLNSYKEYERSKRIQTYFKFLFVREPLHRLLSAYKDKFIGLRTSSIEPREKIVKSYRPQDFEPDGDNNVTFTEFIRYFSNNNVLRNEHWLQYEELCQPCVMNYDFIGHLETLEEDGLHLLKMAGINDRVTFPPIHKSTGSDEVLEYYSQVPSLYIKQLGEQYRNDFEMFGYEYLGPVKELLKQSISNGH